MKSPLPHTRNRLPRPKAAPGHAGRFRMHCPHCGAAVKAAPDAFLNERHCASCDRMGIFVHEPPRHVRHALTMPSKMKSPVSASQTPHATDPDSTDPHSRSTASPLPQPQTDHSMADRAPSPSTEPGVAVANPEPSASSPSHVIHPAKQKRDASIDPQHTHAGTRHASETAPASAPPSGTRQRFPTLHVLAALGVLGLWMLSGIVLHTLGQQSARDEAAALRAAEAQAHAAEAARFEKENQRLHDALRKTEAETDPALRAATLSALRDQARAGGFPVQAMIEDAYIAAVLARQEAVHTTRLEDMRNETLALHNQMNMMQVRLDAFAAEQTNQTMAANRMQSQLEQRDAEIDALQTRLAQYRESATDTARTIAALKDDTASLQDSLRQQEQLRLKAEAERAMQTRSTPPPVVVVNTAPPQPIIRYSIIERRESPIIFHPIPRRIHRRRHHHPHHHGFFPHGGGFSGSSFQGGIQFRFR